MLGVRPENVLFVPEGDAGALPAEVYVAEALGNETLVRLQVGSQELVARADASYEPAVGSPYGCGPIHGARTSSMRAPSTHRLGPENILRQAQDDPSTSSG